MFFPNGLLRYSLTQKKQDVYRGAILSDVILVLWKSFVCLYTGLLAIDICYGHLLLDACQEFSVEIQRHFLHLTFSNGSLK